MALNNLGSALPCAGRCDEAIAAHRQALAIYVEASDRRGEGQALNGLGLALAGARRFDEAITVHQQPPPSSPKPATGTA
jgi:Flp pilus assembly protein TadD